jgi:hypothetical protein
MSVQVRNETRAPVSVGNFYQIWLMNGVPDSVEKRKDMEGWLWGELLEKRRRQNAKLETLRVPVPVAGAAFFLENDEGPPVPEEYLEKLRRGGGVYVLGTLEIEGENSIPYCGFARKAGGEFVMCLEHNQ